jgi:signal transduction histidine kinase
MKVRFIIIFVSAMILILLTSLLASYTIITNTQKAFENELVYIRELSAGNTEVQKRVSLYKAFSDERAIQITRDVLSIFGVEAAFMTILFLLFVFGVTKPLEKLSSAVKFFYFDSSKPDLFLEETGTEEIRILIRAFNEMIIKLKNYEKILGNIQKYKGWKEISRIIVHEINNIISPIQTYVEFLVDKVNERDKVNFILDKLNDMRLILHKFRDISHFPDAHLEDQNVIPIIEEVCREFKRAKFERNGFDPFILKIDTVLFKEIIRNIVKNGIEASGDSTVEVKLIDEGSRKYVNITDNGPGMTLETIDRIFEPGFSTKKGNIGIGLSIVKSLTQEQNAMIEVESSPDRGTTFQLIFPSPDAH